ncbi:MAG: type II toxin-antitoxin system RelE/ParE family toxin [Xanthobacteraceae bacterium]|nr:type II toxin-antitoxin system RelE/ParE family toxin [Xanthobacteraceae bacterium]
MSRPAAIRLSRLARTDILDIWTYVAADSPTAADRVLDRIERVLLSISQHPELGRERPEIMPGLRSFAVMSWVVFYRIEDDSIIIARVLHGARDLDELDY